MTPQRKHYARSCGQCLEGISTPWLSRLWAFDRKHKHTKETA